MKKRTVIMFLALGCLRLLSCAQTAGKGEDYILAAVWDEKTIGAKLTTPSGLAIDKDGNLYVAGLWSVDKLSPEGKLVMRIDWKEKEGSPVGVALDSKGNIYVCCQVRAKIWVFSPEGGLINKWGEPGFGEGKIDLLEAIAIDSNDHLYLAGGTRFSVQKFMTDGRFIAGLGNPVSSIVERPGTGPGDFWSVMSIAIDPMDNVYIADWHHGRIQKFSQEGKFIRMWGKRGEGEEEFSGGPMAVAADAEGGVYVAEFGEAYAPDFHAYIKKFTSDGHYVRKFGLIGKEYKGHEIPAIVVDKKGYVYFCDKMNGKIYIFKKKGET